ncbi:MAG: glycosyltransferase family 2 protein [Bacteroidetes bacterium]|nr:glycosyltransferase family 2 protein [Bacteroidota bacterium]
MFTLKICFWILVFIVFYSYLGYGIVLFVLIKLKRIFKGRIKEVYELGELPEVTLFIAAYNEKDFVDEKIKNSRELDYPADKLKFVWITDGSNDGTPEILEKFKDVIVLHEKARNGKIGAINRGMKYITSPIVVFCDANTMIGSQSIKEIVRLFKNPKVGCVSGEKRIFKKEKDSAASAGEGIYWKYESKLKQWDAELYSVVGAAGELFAIRTILFEEVEQDTLLDDFIISLRIALKGYTIQYNPEAYAIESSSANVKEEMKRKVRIAAGGIQSIIRLKELLNIFKYGVLSFQYISHRVLRWSIAPLSLPFIYLINFILAYSEGIKSLGLFFTLFILQNVFYLSALIGWYLENHKLRIKILFVPYYFFIMNLSVFLGFKRFYSKQQSVNWERAKRGS